MRDFYLLFDIKSENDACLRFATNPSGNFYVIVVENVQEQSIWNLKETKISGTEMNLMIIIIAKYKNIFGNKKINAAKHVI